MRWYFSQLFFFCIKNYAGILLAGELKNLIFYSLKLDFFFFSPVCAYCIHFMLWKQESCSMHSLVQWPRHPLRSSKFPFVPYHILKQKYDKQLLSGFLGVSGGGFYFFFLCLVWFSVCLVWFWNNTLGEGVNICMKVFGQLDLDSH